MNNLSDLQIKMIKLIMPYLKEILEEENLYYIDVDKITYMDIKTICKVLKVKSTEKKLDSFSKIRFKNLVDYELLNFILEDRITDSCYKKIVRILLAFESLMSDGYPMLYGLCEEDLDKLTVHRKKFLSNILKTEDELPNNYILQSIVFSEKLEELDSINYKYAFLYGLIDKFSFGEKKLEVTNLDFYNMIIKYEENGDIFDIDNLKLLYSNFICFMTGGDSPLPSYYTYCAEENNSGELSWSSSKDRHYYYFRKLDDKSHNWSKVVDNNETLLNKIKKEYRDYKLNTAVFTVQKFVAFYNQKYNDDVSGLIGSTCSMSLNEPLVRYFCEKDKRFAFVGFEELIGETRSGKDYRSQFSQDYLSALSEERNKNHFISLYDLKIKNMGTIRKQTLGYFLLKNIPQKHWELFNKLIRHKEYEDFFKNFCNLTDKDYRYVAGQLEADFISELENTNLSQFEQIYERYCNYVSLCRVEDTNLRSALMYDINKIITKRENDISVPFVKDLLGLMDTSINLYEFHLNNEEYFNTFKSSSRLKEEYYFFDNDYFGNAERLFANAMDIDSSLENDISLVKQRYFIDRHKYLAEQQKMNGLLEEYKKSSLVDTARTIVQWFVDSEYETVKWFCSKENVDSSYFSKCLETVKENDGELYEKYYSKVLKHKQEKYAAVMGNARQIVDKIINGVEKPDGTFRPFSYLDYKLATTNDFDAFMDLVKDMKDLTKEQLIAVRKFVQSNTSKTSMNNREFMESSYIFKLPDGSSYTATIEDKEKVLQFLKSKHLLSTDYKLLRLTLRGHVLGELDIDEEMKENNSGNKSL